MTLNKKLEKTDLQDLLYEGKAKKIFKVSKKQNFVLLEFKDTLTAFNSKKKGSFKGKGSINREISSLIFRYLKHLGIENHWIADQEKNFMLCQRTQIFPVEIVIRNRLAGSTAKKLNQKEGLKLPFPLFELYYKEDALEDPFINEDQALFLNIVKNKKELEEIKKKSLLINEKLKAFFLKANIDLIDFKIEFGKKIAPKEVKFKETLLLSDEISPDCARLWDSQTQEKLDKDRFRYDLGKVKESYEEVLNRIKKAWELKVL